jgi:hypothetical protein
MSKNLFTVAVVKRSEVVVPTMTPEEIVTVGKLKLLTAEAIFKDDTSTTSTFETGCNMIERLRTKARSPKRGKPRKLVIGENRGDKRR